MLPTKTEDEKNLSKSEKRKRRLDPEQCLTTSKVKTSQILAGSNKIFSWHLKISKRLKWIRIWLKVILIRLI